MANILFNKSYELVLHSIYTHKNGIGIRDISRLVNLELQSVQRQVKILNKQNLIKIVRHKNKFSIFYNHQMPIAKAYAVFFNELERQQLILTAQNLSSISENLFHVINDMQNFVRSYK